MNEQLDRLKEMEGNRSKWETTEVGGLVLCHARTSLFLSFCPLLRGNCHAETRNLL